MAIPRAASAVLLKPEATTPASAPSAPVLGAQHVCIDIETMNASAAAIELSARFYKAPWNVKDPAKLKEREAAAMAKIEEKSALLDLAAIGVVGIITESCSAIFHTIKTKKKVEAIKSIPAELYAFKDERLMLGAAREWMDPRSLPNSKLIGHNIVKFDLPKLRGGYVRNRLALPRILRPEAKDEGVTVYDTMRNFLYGFTTERAGDQYISQEEMVARLGLPGHKHRLSGAEIPRMIEEGKAEEVLAYNYLDIAEAYAAFLAMTGQYKDQPQE